jgi:hypothetical protein
MITRHANDSDHDSRSRPARQERTMDNKTVSAFLLPLASLSQESPSTWAIRLVTCATETTGTRRALAKA